MVKIALVYTGFNTGLMSLVESGVQSAMGNEEVVFITYANPEIIKEVLDAGYVTPKAAKLHAKCFFEAMTSDVDAVLSVCSTLGDVAEAAKPLFKMFNIPFVRIDEAMMQYALKDNKRIAFVATSDAIMAPNSRLLDKCKAETGSGSSITKLILPDLIGQAPDKAAQIIIDKIKPNVGQFDIVVLTQASMGPVTPKIEEGLRIQVISSIKFGAQALADSIKRRS